jgi:predicted glutamine amidotransferase
VNPNQTTIQNEVDPYQMNTQVANGFGLMFYNMNDPLIAQSNVPIKQDASFHTATIVGTIIMIVGVIVGAIGFRNFLV